MLALFGAVFTASLLGSTHCAGMCGAFALFAVGDGPVDASAPAPRRHSKLTLTAMYNLGRLITYTILGAVAGSLGAALDLGGSLVGIQRAAAILAGALMIGFGTLAVLRAVGVHVPKAPLPKPLVDLARAGHARAFTLPPLLRPLAVGLLTTLLPCGWLYAFVITSAGTASPMYGALAMLAFWLGTLPIMAGICLGAQSLLGPLRRHLPIVTSLLLVAVGLWTLLGRVTAPAIAADAFASMRPGDVPIKPSCPLCHPEGER